jgi:hypothetical protein
MVKKLEILIITLLLSSTIFSQKDTSRICFDYKVAKQIALDLTKGDSAKAELEVTKDLVKQLNGKIAEQDSVIKIYVKKDTNYLSQVKTYSDIQEKQSVIIAGLEKDVANLADKNNNLKKGLKWIGGGFVATLISLTTLLSVK